MPVAMCANSNLSVSIRLSMSGLCSFDKLITALRTAIDNDGTLDKEATSYNDIFDAFRLALKFYRYEDSSE